MFWKVVWLSKSVSIWKVFEFIYKYFQIFTPQYKATDFVVPGCGKLEMKFTPSEEGGEVMNFTVYDFKDGGGVAMGMFNTDKSIRDFAVCCMNYAIERKYPLYLR